MVSTLLYISVCDLLMYIVYQPQAIWSNTHFPYTTGSHGNILLLLLSFPTVQLSGKCYIFPCVEHELKSLKSRVLENRKMSTGYEDFKEIAPTLPMQ